MERSLNDKAARINSSPENFDCRKMKNLILNNSSQTFGEKFKSWIQDYTKNTKEKVWMDIEYYGS